MRKLSIVLCLTMCLLVVGCSSKQETDTSTIEKETTEETVDNGTVTEDTEKDVSIEDVDLSDYQIEMTANIIEYESLVDSDLPEDVERRKEIAELIINAVKDDVPEITEHYDEETGLFDEEVFGDIE